jgi:adenine-specific DNA-methyltransferase
VRVSASRRVAHVGGHSAQEQVALFGAGDVAHDAEALRNQVRLAAEAIPERLRVSFAQAACARSIERYWSLTNGRQGRDLRPLGGSAPRAQLRREVQEMVDALGEVAAKLTPEEAAYLVGSAYASMLPAQLRADRGVYYTPPILADHLLDASEMAGTDWGSARVLDPACGGGAFLGPVATRMVRALKGCNRRVVVRNIGARLRGYEIDPFAASISQVFLDATLHDLLGGAGNDIANAVEVVDSLTRHTEDQFDLVVGNPPYGRVTLPPELRSIYSRSLFGHANLYGLFMDLAIRKSNRERGVVAYVTPTSFLSGEYFKRLRHLLSQETSPVYLDFVEGRAGVFDGVLQETLLATFRRGTKPRQGRVRFLNATEAAVRVEAGGEFSLPAQPDRPWVLPRTATATAVATRLAVMPARLVDWGYRVSTGPLVWNRHKNQLRKTASQLTVPLLWAECVGADGSFEFRASRRNHQPYFLPRASDHWLLIQQKCVLLQRTTSKEQPRRLIAAELPEGFLREHGSVTVENHLNMLIPSANACVDTATLAAFLNSRSADEAFRCISGSVAVSAYELESLPLPEPRRLGSLSEAVSKGAPRSELDSICEELLR